MSFAVLLAVLGAALLHAIWNAVVKTGDNKLSSMMVISLSTGAIGLAVVAMRPLPGLEIWPWLLASGVIHSVYMLVLGYAYEHGDLSRVYPIARGAAPLFVLAAGGLVLGDVLGDVLSRPELAGIMVLGAGILFMTRGVFQHGESRRLVPFALASAMTTAAYSIVDGIGARLSSDPITFVGWALFLTSVFYLPAVLALRGRHVLRVSPAGWGLGILAGIASYAAYTIVVWAMTQAPIVLVMALRETSILFAVLIGWLVFGERMHRGKVIAVLLIVAGVALTRL